MSRRRYISSAISIDKVVAAVEKKYGDFAGLLYDRMIPHAEDDATITGDPEDLLAIVFPHRRDKTAEDVAAALAGIEAEGLIGWDREGAKVYFPIASFYKYQTYVRLDRQRSWDWQGNAPEPAKNMEDCLQSAQISEDNNKTAQMYASSSVSSSVSVSHSVPSAATAAEVRLFTEEFTVSFWPEYPNKKAKPDGLKAFIKARKKTSLEIILAGLANAKASKDWTKQGGEYIPYPASWLNDDGWENEYRPADAFSPGAAPRLPNGEVEFQVKRPPLPTAPTPDLDEIFGVTH